MTAVWQKNNKLANTAIHYTGQAVFKLLLDTRQTVDRNEHFIVALFRYIQTCFKNITQTACLDDKRQMKVGKPEFPVAATEWRRESFGKARNQF